MSHTSLFTFDWKQHALDFAMTLAITEKETGQSPCRIADDYSWRCRDKSFFIPDKSDFYRYIKPYQIARVNVRRFQSKARLEGILVKRVVRNALGDFVIDSINEDGEYDLDRVVPHLNRVLKRS